MSKYSELSQIGSAPISKDSPAGESVSYEADYDLLEGEIKKLQSLSGDTVAWNLVIEKSADILSKKSKDLTVASWLCLALFKESKLEGLTVGLGIYYDTIDHFWQIMHPSLKRIRGRTNVIEWLFENIDKTFSNLKLGMEDENNLKLCNELIVKITDQLDEKLGDNSPVAILNNLKRNLTGRIKEFEVKKAPPPSAEKQARPIKVAPASPVIPQKTEINNKENANKALKESLGTIKKAAVFLQNVNDANPLYYRLIRMSSWSVIQNLPSHTNFVTPIPEIQAAVIKAFDNLEGKGDWLLLLKRAEAQFVNNPLWLDLQRYSYIASDNLGGTYEPIKEVIANEFISFINRFSDIIDLKFAGGTPFAEDRTKFWLEDLMKQKTSSGAQSVKEQEEGKQEEVIKKIRNLLIKNEMLEAVEIWKKEYVSYESEKNIFKAKLQLAMLFVNTRKYREAILQLELLDDEIKNFNLEKWDPNLSAEVIKLLIQSIQTDSKVKSPGMAEKLVGLKKRLYKLDITSALSFA